MSWGTPGRIDWNVPADALVVEQNEFWTIYLSTSKRCIYIYPNSYQTNSLPLTAGDLRRMLQKLESAPNQSTLQDKTGQESGMPGATPDRTLH